MLRLCDICLSVCLSHISRNFGSVTQYCSVVESSDFPGEVSPYRSEWWCKTKMENKRSKVKVTGNEIVRIVFHACAYLRHAVKWIDLRQTKTEMITIIHSSYVISLAKMLRLVIFVWNILDGRVSPRPPGRAPPTVLVIIVRPRSFISAQRDTDIAILSADQSLCRNKKAMLSQGNRAMPL